MSDDLNSANSNKANAEVGAPPKKISVVICWHMHQPQYANRLRGEYQLPWTYLHAIKDYSDMAAHLESQPGAKAVVNFVPILLEQLDDYAAQIQRFLQTGQEIHDSLLQHLAAAVLPSETSSRIHIIKDCLKANEERIINRFPVFKQLAELARWYIKHPDSGVYINNQFLVDILVWYHLGWLGEFLHRGDDRVKRLIAKEQDFNYQDRRELLTIIGEVIASIIPRYKALRERGQVELSMTPYAHPIMPLLLDVQSAREAWPEVKLPLLEHYPDGEARARWHLQYGQQVFQHYFGAPAQGCWPSEGSVSLAVYKLLDQAGFRWCASGEQVLQHSLKKFAPKIEPHHAAYRCYRFDGGNLRHFFRDDGLSDMVGFTYSTWHADDAVANLLENLRNIAASEQKHENDCLVSIILDGENAWEYYPNNGFYFLSALYKKLANHADFELTTYQEWLDKRVNDATLDKQTVGLENMVAGSWVYGTFSTWIGEASKNRAWDMLGEAKRCYDERIASGQLSNEQCRAAELQLAVCEGSDWFWWFGDYNPAGTVGEFDQLYRMQLANLYQILGEQPPDYLSHSFAHGGGEPQHGGVMRRAS